MCKGGGAEAWLACTRSARCSQQGGTSADDFLRKRLIECEVASAISSTCELSQPLPRLQARKQAIADYSRVIEGAPDSAEVMRPKSFER